MKFYKDLQRNERKWIKLEIVKQTSQTNAICLFPLKIEKVKIVLVSLSVFAVMCVGLQVTKLEKENERRDLKG